MGVLDFFRVQSARDVYGSVLGERILLRWIRMSHGVIGVCKVGIYRRKVEPVALAVPEETHC